MGFMQTVKNWFRPSAASQRYQSYALSQADASMFGVPRTASGALVTQSLANSLSAFWACPTAIATDIATMPVSVYRRSGKFREELPDHPITSMLYDLANPALPAIHFRDVMLRSACVLGNAYALIDRSNRGEVIGLHPIKTDQVTPVPGKEKGTLSYEVRGDGRVQTIPKERMFHLRGPSDSAWKGMHLLAVAAESVGLGLTMQEYAAGYFANGGTMRGVLEHPDVLSPEGLQKIVASMKQAGNKTLILEQGMKFNSISSSPDESQLLESRNHSVIEICRWFRMPPHIIQHYENINYSSGTLMDLNYVKYTLMPWAIRFENEVRLKLLGVESGLYLRHNFASLERADILTRYQVHKDAFYLGTRSPNEIRAMEDEDPIDLPSANMWWMQANMVPLDVAADGLSDVGMTSDNPTPPGLGATDNVPEPADDLERKHRATVEAAIAAHRPVLVDTLRRALTKESTAMAKHARRDDFAAWASEYRAKFRATLVDMLTAPVTATVETLQIVCCVDSPLVPAALVERFADEYMVASATSAEIDVEARALLHSRDWTAYIGTLFVGDGNHAV